MSDTDGISLDRSNLISTYGDTTVTLSSANSYSYEKVKISFSQYCEDYTGPQNLQTLGNGQTRSSLYLRHYHRSL